MTYRPDPTETRAALATLDDLFRHLDEGCDATHRDDEGTDYDEGCDYCAHRQALAVVCRVAAADLDIEDDDIKETGDIDKNGRRVVLFTTCDDCGEQSVPIDEEGWAAHFCDDCEPRHRDHSHDDAGWCEGDGCGFCAE